MKTHYTLLSLLIILLAPAYLPAQQPCKDYTCVITRAKNALASKNYRLAFEQLESAEGYPDKKVGEIAALRKQLFDAVEREKEEAKRQKVRADSNAVINQRQTLRAEANYLAYKSQIALQNGDRNGALQIAIFAHRFVEPKNLNVVNSLTNAVYYNDNPEHEPLALYSKLEGHLNSINCMVFSTDNRLLATGSDDETIKIWNLQEDKLIMTLKENRLIKSIAFSPDGKSLASASFEAFRIWDLSTGMKTMPLSGHTSWVNSLSYSHDGKRLATGSNDQTVNILDVNSGKVIMKLSGHLGPVTSLVFSPDDRYLATCSDDYTVKIWDLSTGLAIKTLEGTKSNFNCVVFSPDGLRVAACSDDPIVHIWDFKSGEELITLTGHESHVFTISFSPDGKHLASGSDDKSVRIWDVNNGRLLSAYKDYPYQVRSVAYSVDGKKLATSGDNSVKIWNLKPGKESISLAECSIVTFSPDGRVFATNAPNGTVKIRDSETHNVISTLVGHSSNISCLAFSPDGKNLAVGLDGEVKIWELSSNKLLMSINAHKSSITDIVFSLDQNQLITASRYENVIKIWDLTSGLTTKTLSMPNLEPSSIAISPNGKYLAIGTKRQDILFWDLKTGDVVKRFDGHEGYITKVLFSKNGHYLISSSIDKTIRVWDISSRKELMTFEEPNSIVNDIACSPDDRFLASVTGDVFTEKDNVAKIRDLESGTVIMTLSGHREDVSNVIFSPDGERLVTYSFNENITLFWSLNPDVLIAKMIQKHRLGSLSATQLAAYNLESLLDLHPDNESKLIATRETWQIKAFADLAAQQAAGSNILSRVAAPYARANRLYAAALVLQDEPLIRMDYAKMLRKWAAIYRDDGQEPKAKELEAKANNLWKP